MKWIQSDFKIIQTLRDEYNPELIAQLEQFHIHTLEDIIALWEIDGLAELIAAAAGTSVQKMEELVAVSRRQVTIESLSRYLKPLEPETLADCQFGTLMPENVRNREDSRVVRYPPLSKAYHVEIAVSEINHIPHLQPIQNQGRRGTCVGFGTTVVREFLCDHDMKLSEQFLYWGAKSRDGIPDKSGTWISCAIQCLEEDGICREVDWPYHSEPGETEGQGPPPDKALQTAGEFKILKGIPIARNSVDSMRAILSGTGDLSEKVISFAIPVYKSWYHNPITFKTGRLQMPLPGETHLGGHCMTLVGFKDDTLWPGGGYFILRNSWGTQWAVDCEYGAGYGTVPYAFIAEYCWDAWTIDVEEAHDNGSGRQIRWMGKKFMTMLAILASGMIVWGGIHLLWQQKKDKTAPIPVKAVDISETVATAPVIDTSPKPVIMPEKIHNKPGSETSPKVKISSVDSTALLNELAELVTRRYRMYTEMEDSTWVRLSGDISVQTVKIENPVPHSSLVERKFVTTLTFSDIHIFLDNDDRFIGVLKQDAFQETALHPDRSRTDAINQLADRILHTVHTPASTNRMIIDTNTNKELFQSLLYEAKKLEALTEGFLIDFNKKED